MIYQSEYAPIVYGRTYEVDFRFIELPEDFRENSLSGFQIKDQDWLERHIRSSTLAAEKLSGKPRWSIFKNEKYSVVGITCMADEVANEKTKDRESRALYVFLGYVFRSIDLPKIPMHLDIFKHMYRSILDRWEDKPFEQASKEPMWSSYVEIPSNFSINKPNPKPLLELNLNPKKIVAWVDSEEYRRELWSAGLCCQSPVSICLGLPNKNTALKGNFLNGIILDLPSVIELNRDPIEHTREIESFSAEVDMPQNLATDRKQKKEQKNQPSQTNERNPIQQKSNSQTVFSRKSRDRFDKSINQYEGDEWVPPLDETNPNSVVEEIKQGLADGIEDFQKVVHQIFYREPQSSDDRDKELEDNLDRDLSTHPKRGSGKQKSPQVESSQTQSDLDIGFKPKKQQQNESRDNKEWF